MGFKFVNESSFYVKHFKDLVEPSENTAEDAQDPKITIARKKCSSVRCALATIMGQEESVKALYLIDKYRLNVAPMKYISAGYFKNRDLDIILETMSLVPPHLLPLADIQQLTHISSTVKQEENIYADSSILIYDLWNKESADMKKYLLFHEIAHNWSNTVSQELDESADWFKITGWKKISAFMMVNWEHAHQGDFSNYPWSSKYASVNSWEDFAESVSAYRFVPEQLLQSSPERYAFIKHRVFGGIEFRDGKNCHLKTREMELAKIENQALAALDYKMSVYNSVTTNIDKVSVRKHILDSCGVHLKNSILNKSGAVTSFNVCFREVMTKTLANSFNWVNLDRQSGTLRSNFRKAKKDLIEQWLEQTFVTEQMKSVRWAPTKDFDCNTFAKNYKGLFIQNSEAYYELAPAIGYWICADSKRKSAKTSSINKASFDSLKKWLYPQLGI
ncbi:hypothetical protein [Bdellovibrio sp. HCB-110]|uniref:hypothetical protein n=1 Tax=Bdellovibrio sp. HCB-110 TaxID=3391182 RepID=UPI0039B53167